MMKTLTALLLIAVFALAACTSDHVYRSSMDTPEAHWCYGDSLVFDFEIKDTAMRYDLFLDIDYQANVFPFQNLYLRLNTCFPNGKRLSKPLSFDLFAPTGEPNGNGKCQFILQEKAFFDQKGKHRLVVEQFTRRDSLPGVEAIALEIKAR